MSEKDFQRIIKVIEEEIVPPYGLKEKMLERILMKESKDSNITISKIERLIYERPLRFACVFSTVISGVLWALMGNEYTGILSYLIRIR